jgi:hypothetical protein
MGFRQVELEGDAMNVIDAVNSGGVDDDEWANLRGIFFLS